MNILLINHYAGSPDLGMEFRPYYMAKEWQKAGHHVRIVGGSFSHLRKKQPCEYREIVDNVEYCWIPVNRYKGNGVGRIFSMFLFVFKLYHYFVEYLRNFEPDIVIASSTYPIDSYPAYKIAKHYHAKLIYEVHDLWPLSPMELGGYSKKHPFIQIMQKAENDCYRYVDTVVSMLPKAEEHMREHGLGKGKFHYVPNGIVLSDWNNPKGIPEEHGLLLSRFQKEGKFIVGFAGAHGIANSLYAVIDAVSSLAEQNVVLVLVGGGQEKENLIKYAHKKEIVNVYFLPTIDKLAIPNLLKEMDVLYIGLQKQSLFRFGISPNKMFDYMASGHPTLSNIQTRNDIFVDNHCGMTIEAGSPQAMADGILKFAQMDPTEYETYCHNATETVKEYDFGYLTDRLEETLKKEVEEK